MTSSRIGYRVAVLALAGVLGSSCGGEDRSREAAMEAQAERFGIDADVSLDDSGEVSSVTVRGVGGSRIGQNVALPAGFPDDIPIDEAWNIIGVTQAQGGFMVQAMADAGLDVDAAVETLETRFADAGWTAAGVERPTPQMTRMSFEKDLRIAGVMMIAAGGPVSVQVVTMPKP